MKSAWSWFFYSGSASGCPTSTDHDQLSSGSLQGSMSVTNITNGFRVEGHYYCLASCDQYEYYQDYAKPLCQPML